MTSRSPIPVIVLTGFLGSGKTTLLQRLLQTEEGRGSAVLINEFGEVSLDHLLVKSVRGGTVVLQNGCVCCSVRSELRAGLRELVDGRAKGEVPPFDRIVIETTGLADPVPVVQTITVDPMLRNHLRLASLVSTVDALNGLEQINTQDEAMRQAATADRLVITKTDLSNERQTDKLQRFLERINPTAPVARAPSGQDLWCLLLGEDFSDPQSRREQAWTISHAAEKLESTAWAAEQISAESHHSHSIVSFALRFREPIDWSPFVIWLSLLVHRHGRQVLRIKGLLDVPGAKGPISLNAVQRFIHLPVHLDAWPDDDHTSRLIFIVQGLEEAAIRSSLADFLRRAAHTTPLSVEAV
jgi:G3E family GTPase